MDISFLTTLLQVEPRRIIGGIFEWTSGVKESDAIAWKDEKAMKSSEFKPLWRNGGGAGDFTPLTFVTHW